MLQSFETTKLKSPIHKMSIWVMQSLLSEKTNEKQPIDMILNKQVSKQVAENREKFVPIIKPFCFVHVKIYLCEVTEMTPIIWMRRPTTPEIFKNFWSLELIVVTRSWNPTWKIVQKMQGIDLRPSRTKSLYLLQISSEVKLPMKSRIVFPLCFT